MNGEPWNLGTTGCGKSFEDVKSSDEIRSVEDMIAQLKKRVAQLLETDMHMKDLYKLAQIIKVLVEVEREVGGSDKEMKEFIEKLMRKWRRVDERKVGKPHSEV